MKFKSLALVFAIALLSYLCGFGASIAISKNIFVKGSVAGYKYNGQGKPGHNQAIPAPPADLLTTPPTLVDFSDRVKAGELAYIRVRTLPGSICTIYYINPDRHYEGLPGKIFQITGSDGLCGWSWTIPPESSTGNAVIYLSAGGHLQQHTFTIYK